MMRTFRGLTVAGLALCLWTSNCLAQSNRTAAGHWEGTIAMPAQDVGMSVDLGMVAADTWKGSVSFAGSNTADAPVSDLTVKDGAVRFALIGIEGNPVFEGTLNDDGTGIAGMASNARGAVPFHLKRTGEAKLKIPPASSALSQAFEGTWEGSLVDGDRTARIVLNLTRGDDGTAAGTLSSVGKGETFPITTVTLNHSEILLELRIISGSYHGTLTDGRIVGEWKEGGSAFPVVFNKTR